MEVFGAREKALRWLNTPVRSLGDQTPLSLLNTPEGVAQVQDTLGRVEHGRLVKMLIYRLGQRPLSPE